jgi:hypothetical protein
LLMPKDRLPELSPVDPTRYKQLHQGD